MIGQSQSQYSGFAVLTGSTFRFLIKCVKTGSCDCAYHWNDDSTYRRH